MDYRILMTDTLHSGVQRLADLPVWQECGFSVSGRSTDVKSTVQAAAAQNYDMILCIHRPGDSTASELLQLLKKKSLDIPVLVVSQQEDAAAMRQCFLLGCTDFITEPVTENEIRAVLERISVLQKERSMDREYAAALHDAFALLEENGVQKNVIEKLTAFYRETPYSAITTSSAADYFGFNKDYFCRYFKLQTGMTFSEFHKDVQMEYAKLLLLTGHFKVQNVSDLLGFSSADYFTRAFKKRMGKTPSEFKKNC